MHDTIIQGTVGHHREVVVEEFFTLASIPEFIMRLG